MYYEIEAKSASYLKTLSALDSLGRLPADTPTNKTFKEHFFIGTQVHLAIETNGESLNNLCVLDNDLLQGLKGNESNVAIADDPIKEYVRLYSNAVTKPMREFIDTPYDDLTEIQKSMYNKVKATVKPWVEKAESYISRYQDAIKEDKIILNDLVSNPQKVYDIIENSFAAVNNSNDYNFLLTKADEQFKELVVLWDYKHDLGVEKFKSMLDWVIIDHKNKEILLVDIKTHSDHPDGFSKSYRNHKYYTQLSVYNKALEHFVQDKDYENYKIVPYILHVSTSYFYCKLERVSYTDLFHAEYGGHYRLFSKYNDLEELCVFMSEDEYNISKSMKLINNSYNKERFYPGFKELLENERLLRDNSIPQMESIFTI